MAEKMRGRGKRDRRKREREEKGDKKGSRKMVGRGDGDR